MEKGAGSEAMVVVRVSVATLGVGVGAGVVRIGVVLWGSVALERDSGSETDSVALAVYVTQ